jgi:hypothetical protein
MLGPLEEQAAVSAGVDRGPDLLPILAQVRAKGLTLQRIADRLNGMAHTTRRGRKWSPTQVAPVLRRMLSTTNRLS